MRRLTFTVTPDRQLMCASASSGLRALVGGQLTGAATLVKFFRQPGRAQVM